MSHSLSEQEIRRREELDALKARGVNPYPYAWPVDTHTAEILQAYDDARHDPEQGDKLRVVIAGRIMSVRVMGKAAFFHVQDATGKIQVYIRRDDLPEDVALSIRAIWRRGERLCWHDPIKLLPP